MSIKVGGDSIIRQEISPAYLAREHDDGLLNSGTRDIRRFHE